MSRSAAVEALARAAYLLERGRRPLEMVAAFRRAIEVVSELGTVETEAAIRAGTLEDLVGIDANAGEVITASVLEIPSTYLARLERDTQINPAEGAELLAALKGDCRCHTTWSNGWASIPEMAAAAEALGHEYLVITDRSLGRNPARDGDGPTVEASGNGLDEHRLRSQLAEIDVLNMGLAPFRVLTGIEVGISEDGSLGLSEDLLSALDVVVATIHDDAEAETEPTTIDPAAMSRRLVTAIANPHTDILGHYPASSLPDTDTDVSSGSRPTAFDPDAVFAACNRYDTAVEIACDPQDQNQRDELLSQAMAWGTKFAINSNAHARGQLEWQANGCHKAAGVDLDPERVINTWDADQLVSWAANHPD